MLAQIVGWALVPILAFATWAYAQPCVTFADLVIVKNAPPEIVEPYLRKWKGAMARAARQERADLHAGILAKYRAWFDDVQPLGMRDFAALQATPVPERICGG